MRKQLQKTIASTRSELNEKAVALSVVNSGNASVRDTEQVEIVAEDPPIGVYVQVQNLISCPFRLSDFYDSEFQDIRHFAKLVLLQAAYESMPWLASPDEVKVVHRKCLCAETSAWCGVPAPCHATAMIFCNINFVDPWFSRPSPRVRLSRLLHLSQLDTTDELGPQIPDPENTWGLQWKKHGQNGCLGWVYGIPNMGVSKNRGAPKWMVYSGRPYWNGWFGFGGSIIFGNTHICRLRD